MTSSTPASRDWPASGARSRHAGQSSRPHDPTRPWYARAAQLLPRDPGRWIDLGCGRGELLTLAHGHDLQTAGYALDLDRASVRAVMAGACGTPAGALVADLSRPLPFATAALDGASLIEVIEHVATAERLVDELARVVRPGGWLVVTTPNVVHWTYRWRTLTGHPPKQEGYHLRFFTERTLRALFAQRGFEIEARRSFGKQALATKLVRLAGGARDAKVRYRVPRRLEPLFAQHFVWRLRRR